MRLLFLTPSLQESDGWGRYASGFLREAKRRFGEGNVVVPEPSTLRSRVVRWKTPFLAAFDRRRLMPDAERCDLIHAAAETMAPLAMLLSRVTGKPYVISAHGTYADMATYRWYVRWIYRRAFTRARAILPVSTYTERLVKKQFPAARTIVIPGGFDAPATAHRPREDDAFRILSVGALKPRKGFHTLIAAMGRLKERDIRLDIIGDEGLTSYVAKLKSMMAVHGLGERVILHGHVPQGRLEAFYAAADLFVLPSEHDGTAFEGLGLVYLEALARGLPVIGSRDSGAEDVIEDGTNGFLVEPGDTGGLAERIARLADDPQLLSKMASEAPKSVEAFRWDAVGKKMHELYLSCLD